MVLPLNGFKMVLEQYVHPPSVIFALVL
uniref:Uncharacterized protein n=1 Tax=Anguilla anguilla TaxID=7936 RepID=A0A0E9TG30_ANGAN